MSVSKAPALEPAAGISLESRPQRPDRVPLAKGEYSIASRALGLATYFLSGALAINVSQFLGSPLKAINEDWYNAWIAFTKQSFGLLTMTLTQTFAPTKVIVSGDESVRGQLLKSPDGNLVLDFPKRLVLIANHQIYTDWLYLWWIAYCNGMHGWLYIILKESLKKIPVLGWGMQLSQFIFLKRNWEEDKPNMAKSLQKLNKPTDPMWLLLFPEGTNLAPSTRAKSASWAKKNNISDCQHTLLPRSTGLQFCLDELKGTVEYLYDITVVYEGVPRGQYAQDIFTLKAGYMEGRPPKSVNMHFRRFAVKDIPIHDDRAFELWLRARWREKDVMIEQYYRTGKLPADFGGTKYKSGKILRGCGHMEVPIRASHWYEFLQIFAPMGILAMILYIFYGDLPQKFWNSINKEALQAGTQDVRKAGVVAGKEVKSAGSALGGLTLDDIFEPGKQEETFKAGAIAVQKLLTSPQAQTLLTRADFMQSFLSDPQKMVEDTITDKQQTFMQQLAQEETKRQYSKITPPVPPGSVKPISNGTALTSAGKGNFWNQIKAEEQSRNGSVISAPATKKGTFWDNVKAEEQSRQVGSMISTPAPSKGTFWQDVKAASEAKNKKTAPPLTKQNLARQGNFWDTVQKEEVSRRGTLVTLSSDASTAVASRSKTSAPPKLQAKAKSTVAANSPLAQKKKQTPSTTTAPPKLGGGTTQKPGTTPSVTGAKKVSSTPAAKITPSPAPKKSTASASTTTAVASSKRPPPSSTNVSAVKSNAAKPLSKPPTTAAAKPAPKANGTATPKPPVVKQAPAKNISPVTKKPAAPSATPVKKPAGAAAPPTAKPATATKKPLTTVPKPAPQGTAKKTAPAKLKT